MPTLDELYTQTVNDQKNYLNNLQKAFNEHCDQITKEAQEKLKALPESDTEGRQKVFDEQKKKLDEALSQLKTEIDTSTSKSRHKLEDIHTQREASKLKELEDLMVKVYEKK